MSTTTDSTTEGRTTEIRRKQNRDVQYRIVLYPSEHEALKQAAAEQGVTIAEIIRTRVFRNRTTVKVKR